MKMLYVIVSKMVCTLRTACHTRVSALTLGVTSHSSVVLIFLVLAAGVEAVAASPLTHIEPT